MTEIFFEFDEFSHVCKQFTKHILVTSNLIWNLHGEFLRKEFSKRSIDLQTIFIQDREIDKSQAALSSLQAELFEKGASKQSLIIAMGGGVITDVVGFAASCHHRGVPLCLIPTTLLGMVDASIGGKNGVNTAWGKNTLGSIYLPKAVWTHTEFLNTLPKNELLQGAVESLKHGAIADRDLFLSIVSDLPDELYHQHKLKEHVKKSMQIKLNITDQDLDESIGLRHLLNFGHTLGHAIELGSNYSIPHGTAVALGMLGETWVSNEMGLLKVGEWEVFQEGIFKLGLFKHFPKFQSFAEFKRLLLLDKKVLEKQLRIVLLKEIGKPYHEKGQYCHAVSDHHLKSLYEWMSEGLDNSIKF